MPKKLVLCILFILTFLFFQPQVLFSEEPNINDINSKIEEYKKKLDELGKAKDTLSNQIKYLDSQVALTLLKISQTENQIRILEDEIVVLSVKINKLDKSLDQLTAVFIKQINQNYKLSKRIPPFINILNNHLNEYLKQFKYISAVQKSSQVSIINMETVRTNYDIEKEVKTKKQLELEELKTKLADQKIGLAKQKEAKSHLLSVTQNDEKNIRNS